MKKTQQKIALAAALTIYVGHAPLSHAQQLNDAQIVAIYTQVNSFDIETAMLAQTKNCDPGLTKLARHLSRDHLSVRMGVMELARNNNIGYSMPDERATAQRQHNEVMDRLSQMECGEFETAFLKHDIAFHTSAIEAVRSLLMPATSNAELKEHFKNVLPAFELHLEMAKDVASRIQPFLLKQVNE